MGARVQQNLMLVLPVQIDEASAHLPEGRACCQHAIHCGAAATLGRDLAAYDDFLAAGRLEDRFHRGGFFAGADEVGRRSSADKEADRPDEDGFTGAGLASEDVQPRLELELESVDDGQMSDREETQHVSIVIASSGKEVQRPGTNLLQAAKCHLIRYLTANYTRGILAGTALSQRRLYQTSGGFVCTRLDTTPLRCTRRARSRRLGPAQ
jgi:hypothetical protein